MQGVVVGVEWGRGMKFCPSNMSEKKCIIQKLSLPSGGSEGRSRPP